MINVIRDRVILRHLDEDIFLSPSSPIGSWGYVMDNIKSLTVPNTHTLMIFEELGSTRYVTIEYFHSIMEYLVTEFNDGGKIINRSYTVKDLNDNEEFSNIYFDMLRHTLGNYTISNIEIK